MKSSTARSLAFSTLFVLLFFALLEFSTRELIDAEGPGEEGKLRYIVDDDLLWRYEPNQHVTQPSRGVEYLINSEGLRGADFPVARPEGETRILSIGDSVTLGHLVTEGSSYPQLLERYLAEESGLRTMRVINGGVNAYSTREYLLFLRKHGLSYEPDLVILGFVLNDASLLVRQYQIDRFQAILHRRGESGRLSKLQRYLSRLHFVKSIRSIVERVVDPEGATRARRERQRRSTRETMSLDGDEAKRGWELAMSEIEELARLLRENDIPLLVAAFPHRYQVEESPVLDAPQLRLRALCEARGVHFIDLLPFFLEHTGDTLFVDPVHFSARGNRLVAESIGACLLDRGLLN
jgi:lysophospholipase L1-like esterase